MTKADKIAIQMKDMGYDAADIKAVTGTSQSRVARIERRQRIPINRGLLTNMLLDAFDEAQSAGEMVNAARELGKLHGLYGPEKVLTIQGTASERAKQIKQLSTEDLMRLVESDKNPDTCIIDGELLD